MLRLYVRSEYPNDPNEMLAKILKINNEKRTQDIIATFYKMHQCTHKTTFEFSIKIHEAFEKVMQAQITDGDPPIGENVLINQLIVAMKEENVE